MIPPLSHGLDSELKSEQTYEHIIRQLVADELSWEQELPINHFSEHLDSMQKLSLLVAIEDHFEISFDEEDDAEINTLQELILKIQDKETLKPQTL